MREKRYRLYACLQIMYGIVSTGLAIASFCYLYADVTVLVDDIVANWHSKAIMDIQASPYKCPEGYENAYNYVWPGTYSGCWCGDISPYDKNYYEIKSDLSRGYCDYNQTKAGCDDVRPTSSRPLNIWSTVNGTGTVLCVKRSNETWAQAASQSGETCPPNMTKCGKSVNNAFCTHDSQCPINDIKMSNLILPEDSDVLFECNRDNDCVIMAQDPSSASIIKYQRGDSFDALPTSQLRLNEYSMCFDTIQDDYTPGRGSYGLLVRSKSDCGQQGAPLWNKSAFHLTEAQLFDLNGLTEVIKYLSDFGFYSGRHTGADYQYNLFSRSYIPWSPQCRDQMATLSDKSTELSKLKTIQLVLMIITIIIFGVLGVLVPYIICISGVLYKGDTETCQIVELICKVIQIPLQIYGFVVASHQMASYRSIVDRGCSSTDILVLFNSVKNDISITYYGNAATLVFSGIMLLMSCIFVVSSRIEDNREKKRLVEENLINRESQAHQNNSLTLDLDFKENKGENHLQDPLIYVPSVDEGLIGAGTGEKQTAKPIYQPYNS